MRQTEVTDPDEELRVSRLTPTPHSPLTNRNKRRRERGRRSQAAFRQRQAQATRTLTEHSRRLLDGIQRVIDNTKGDERPELFDAIAHLADVAGLDIQRPLSHAKYRQPDEDLTVNAWMRDLVRGTNDSRSASSFLSTNSGSSRRLACGLWLDSQHYMRMMLPPQDILPYLGEGAHTFGGKLFWTMLEHYKGGCDHRHLEINAAIQKGLDHSNATKDIKVSFIQALIAARLEFKQTGSMNAAHGVAGEEDLGMILCNRIEEEYQADGKDPRLWLSCTGIEQRVRMLAGNNVFNLLQNAAAGKGDSALQAMVKNLYCKFCDTGVCFGDGPRWDIEGVDRLLCNFLRPNV